jgi:hypothetical protein
MYSLLATGILTIVIFLAKLHRVCRRRARGQYLFGPKAMKG